jgi:hypothetical protein
MFFRLNSGMIGDANSIANTLPKYDKDFLNEVKIVVKKIYNSNLFDMISNSRYKPCLCPLVIPILALRLLNMHIEE